MRRPNHRSPPPLALILFANLISWRLERAGRRIQNLLQSGTCEPSLGSCPTWMLSRQAHSKVLATNQTESRARNALAESATQSPTAKLAARLSPCSEAPLQPHLGLPRQDRPSGNRHS